MNEFHRSVCAITVFVVMFNNSAVADYTDQRNKLLKCEKTVFLGGNIRLTDKENKVNDIILKEKLLELLDGYKNVSNFLPLKHFFHAKQDIEKSNIFKILRKIPKFGSLHTHLTAAVSVDYIIKEITYRENIYGCFLNGIFKLRFMKNSDDDSRCNWKSLKAYRNENPTFDDWLKKQLTLKVDDPSETYPTIDDIWRAFKKIFTTCYDMLSYRPVFEDYIYQVLKELYLDNIMYTELKGTFMPLYELDGTVYDNDKFFEVFISVVDKFKQDHPKFVGVRYIHSVYRGVENTVLEEALKELIQLKERYPNFIAGFDFVGYEEEGKTLYDYHEILAEAGKSLKFFFHAGETNWYGHTDLNLADAILLNSSRIGHGFALSRHPELLKLAQSKQIAIELCPISNQVLMLIGDSRHHPVIPLMASGYPVVVCNDDPSVWDATGLSYDWYMTFMAMTPNNTGLDFLKQLAINSILFSSMSEVEKYSSLEKWNDDWDTFLNGMLKNEK